ncbi:hypothetical protein RMCBS344292_11277 [Rhizopus microsporus]|uniref:Derlin n=2 Tax=Rhizopus TaxID=4842 RepID=A0A0A1NZG4_RHIZD|nr:DER1-domain-containing protein [Rhizopus microsporus]CEI97139.1 hypothetical protein RMCBS344292_11277 [Rhizopus microsporus]
MPPVNRAPRNELIEWYSSIPPITRALLTLMITTTTASTLGLIHPSSLILYWPGVKQGLQLWRLISCFFVNRLSLGFAFNVFFLYRNSLQLETEVFRNQPADYVFFYLVTSSLQLAAASFINLYVLSDGLLLSAAYLWSQHYRDVPVSFMFGIRFKAYYLPWAMIASDFIMSGGEIPKASIVGLLSSHIYHYLTTIYPSQGGRRYLQTPDFLRRIFPSPNQPRNNHTNVFGRHAWGRGRRLDS